MRTILLLPLLIVVLPAISPAAQAQGGYGGGFIELLMTGRDPTPVRQPPRAFSRSEDGSASADVHRQPSVYREPMPEPLSMEPQARPPAMRQAALDPQIQRELPARFERQVVDYDGREAPGSVVIHTPTRFLYLVQPGGKALRYGIGVGRPGFEWGGAKSITRKAEWPDWRPPSQMLKRRPDLPRYMAGGPENPMGARGLYLGSSLYRIHGTNEPHTIGQAVSSGCIRMRNEDVIDLYDRVRVGTRVVVI